MCMIVIVSVSVYDGVWGLCVRVCSCGCEVRTIVHLRARACSYLTVHIWKLNDGFIHLHEGIGWVVHRRVLSSGAHDKHACGVMRRKQHNDQPNGTYCAGEREEKEIYIYIYVTERGKRVIYVQATGWAKKSWSATPSERT